MAEPEHLVLTLFRKRKAGTEIFKRLDDSGLEVIPCYPFGESQENYI
jgi:hypothetical protein